MIQDLKQGCIGLWLPPYNTYAMMDQGKYDGVTVTTNTRLMDLSGNNNDMVTSQWAASNRINFTSLHSGSNTRINKADFVYDINDYTVIAKRDLITNNVTSYGFGAQYANDNSSIMFENRAKVNGVWRGSVKSLGVVSFVDLQENGWSYMQKDNYNGIPIPYGTQTEIKTGINFSRLRMLWSDIYCVGFWNRKLSLKEIAEFERLFDTGQLYSVWTGKSLLNNITEMSVQSKIVNVVPDHKWEDVRVQSTQATMTTESYKQLDHHSNMVYADKMWSIDKISEDITAENGRPVKYSIQYKMDATTSAKKLFPYLDFLLCPKMQGITDQDLANGVQLKNLAGDAYDVYNNSSSRYLYPNKRYVRIDDRGWLTYKVDDVAYGDPLWSSYPYSMLGCGAHYGDEQGNYTVGFIWRRQHWVYNETDMWNGVELQQNYQNWNATGMQHYIDATGAANPMRQRLGMCMNSPFNYYPTDMFSDQPADYLLAITYNCEEGMIYPRCAWRIVNLSNGVDSGVHYNCRGQNQRPVNPVNVYWRCPANNTGSVFMLGLHWRGMNENEFNCWVEWMKRSYQEMN